MQTRLSNNGKKSGRRWPLLSKRTFATCGNAPDLLLRLLRVDSITTERQPAQSSPSLATGGEKIRDSQGESQWL